MDYGCFLFGVDFGYKKFDSVSSSCIKLLGVILVYSCVL